LFALRVAGQAIQRWLPLPFLPPSGAFQGSTIPYPVLLPVQLAILAIMLGVARRVRRDTLARREPIGRVLSFAGRVYFLAMLARLAIGLTVPEAPAWFRAPISSVFHLVLATFVLVLAAHHRELPEARLRQTSPCDPC
jgi:hypothetical protein